MALSIGTSIKLNITINNTGMDYTNYSINNSSNINQTTTNPTNQTNNSTSQNNQNNQTIASTIQNTNSTNNNKNQQENNTNTPASKTINAKNNLIQTYPASSTNIKQPINAKQDNQNEITKNSDLQNKKTLEISKIMLILLTMFLTDIFVLTYTLYKTKENIKNKKKK